MPISAPTYTPTSKPTVTPTSTPTGKATATATPTTKSRGCPGGCTEYPTWCEKQPPIKGNISFDSGEKIYHVPGQKYYEATEINPRYDERWFCTEDEAKAAGWRRARTD